jgi:hypothetical protein
MTCRLAAVLFGLTLIDATVLFGADAPEAKGPKLSFEVTSTQRVPFLPGGTVRLEHSYGYLTVEGWDEPEVEVTVIKSTDRFYEPAQKPKADQRLEQIRVTDERRSDKDVAILTALPARTGFSHTLSRIIVIRSMLRGNTRGVTVEYRVHVPRDSRLEVHHDHGYVWVSDVTGDIQVNSHTGDMIVMLPDPGPYSIDARTRLGSISCDVTGKSMNRLSQFLVGSHFDYASQTPKRRVYLRMGRGSIEILQDLPDRPVEKH